MSGVALKDDETGAKRALLEELLSYTANVPDEAKTPKGKRFDVVRIKSVIALALHAHRLGWAVATLLDAGFGMEAAPTVRSVLEHGLTAQWLLQYGDEASYGFVAEQQRQLKTTGKSLSKLVQIQVLTPVDAAALLAAIDNDLKHEIAKTSATPGGHSFAARCGDFAYGEAYYMTYRVLSDYVHPGITIAESYVASDSPLSFRTEPRATDDDSTWLYNTSCGLLWAARAVDMLDRAHPNRESLRRAAQQLGVPDVLRLSGDAQVRRAQDRSKRAKARQDARRTRPSTQDE